MRRLVQECFCVILFSYWDFALRGGLWLWVRKIIWDMCSNTLDQKLVPWKRNSQVRPLGNRWERWLWCRQLVFWAPMSVCFSGAVMVLQFLFLQSQYLLDFEIHLLIHYSMLCHTTWELSHELSLSQGERRSCSHSLNVSIFTSQRAGLSLC